MVDFLSSFWRIHLQICGTWFLTTTNNIDTMEHQLSGSTNMMIRNRTDVNDLLIKKQHYSFGVEANTKWSMKRTWSNKFGGDFFKRWIVQNKKFTLYVLSPKKWISGKSSRYLKQYVLSQPWGKTCHKHYDQQYIQSLILVYESSKQK